MEDDDLIPLSALQHYLFCPRQCALIHVERLWEENLFTAEGRVVHERVHAGGAETRGSLRILRGLEIVSRKFGLAGQADLVELRRAEGKGLSLCPVEYKRGRPKAHRADEVQLCAQALCLEEMFDVPVAHGALYYDQPRRRTEVAFDVDLRALTQRIAAETRALLRAGGTPAPVYEKRKCGACSLFDRCRPKTFAVSASVGSWVRAKLTEEDGEVPCDGF